MSNPDLDVEAEANVPSEAGEFEALATVMRAIQPLSSDARLRVLAAISALLGRSGIIAHGPARALATSTDASLAGSESRFSEDRAPSPKEFLFEKKPNTDVERIACLAYYLTHYRDMPSFKTLDLSKLNTEAAQLKLSNAANATENATKAGLLVPASKGNKQISAIGELYVQALPDRQAAREAVAHAKPKRKKARTGRANGRTDTDA